MFCVRRNVIKLTLDTLRCFSALQIRENVARFIFYEASVTKIHDSVARYQFLLITRPFVTLGQFIEIKSVKSSSLSTVRHKKKSSKSKYTDEEVDNEEEDTGHYVEELDSRTVEDIGGKELIIRVPSLRIDTILKAGLNTSKTKMEEGFYQDRIRINGELAVKKSSMVGLGDEVDLVIGTNGTSDQYLDVSRLIVVAIHFPKEVGTNITVKLRKHKSLTIENYVQKWTSKEE